MSVPTAKEILELHYNMDRDEDGHPVYYDWSAKDAMIAFARLHVEAALKAASENATSYVIGGLTSEVDEDSVLNAYPLTLIK